MVSKAGKKVHCRFCRCKHINEKNYLTKNNIYLKNDKIVIKNKGNYNSTEIEENLFDVSKIATIIIDFQNIQTCEIEKKKFCEFVEKRDIFRVKLLIDHKKTDGYRDREHQQFKEAPIFFPEI